MAEKSVAAEPRLGMKATCTVTGSYSLPAGSSEASSEVLSASGSLVPPSQPARTRPEPTTPAAPATLRNERRVSWFMSSFFIAFPFLPTASPSRRPPVLRGRTPVKSLLERYLRTDRYSW